MAKTTQVNGIDKERIRLLADRLCYLREGQDGLRRRHGLWRAKVPNFEFYDRDAERLAPTLLKPKVEPEVKITRQEWKQTSMLEVANV